MKALVLLEFSIFCVFVFQGNDEEAVVDRGKTSSTLHTNFEKEELESESVHQREEQRRVR